MASDEAMSVSDAAAPDDDGAAAAAAAADHNNDSSDNDDYMDVDNDTESTNSHDGEEEEKKEDDEKMINGNTKNKKDEDHDLLYDTESEDEDEESTEEEETAIDEASKSQSAPSKEEEEATTTTTKSSSSGDEEEDEGKNIASDGEMAMSDDNDNNNNKSNIDGDGADNASPPPRLLITKMELENFKSYAGVQTIGMYHKCFSAVVGPNGSGKSNVTDAMLFVFGKRAKKLRLNKVSELIHKSDAVKGNPPASARVSVYFEEIVDTGPADDDYVTVPNTSHVVTRVAYKNNTSQYKIDGKNCQFKHVAEFLGSKGIDLDNNRFLILQGEVEMISMMPPKGKVGPNGQTADDGLLEYLEEIIGFSKYVEETDDAAQQMDQLTDARQEKLNRVKAVEKEKESLEGAKQEAEALLNKDREIRRKQNILYQIHALTATRDATKYSDEKERVQAKLDKERQQLEESNARLAEMESGLKKQRKEYNTVHKELVTTKEEFAAYERRDIKLREEIKHGKAERKKCDAKIKSETKKETDAEAAREAAATSIPTLEEQIASLTETKVEEDAALETIFDEIKDKTETMRAELEEKSKELAPVQQERATYQAALETAETEVGILTDATERAREQCTAAENELAALAKNQQTKRDAMATAKKELVVAQKRVTTATAELEAATKEETTLVEKNKELLARVENAKAAQEDTKGNRRSPAVRGILKAAKKGGELAKVGVMGRLGDLASIASEYDIAVSTACAMLDHIVVQTTAGAQRCLEFLRKHKLGRASFIPLDKMKKGAHDRQVTTPENAPRLFELIAPGNFAITPALFLAVGDTLVAPDLETATRWAYDFGKRWRVVTVDGKLVEISGTMSGGGKSVRRGGMKLNNNPRGAAAAAASADDDSDDCERLEAEAAELQERLVECRQRRKDLGVEIRGLQKRIKELEVQLPKLTMEIAGFDTTREELTQRIPELQAQCNLSETDAAKLVGLEKKVAKCKTDMAGCTMQASKLEADVARIQKSILNAGGAKLKKQQGICDKLLADTKSSEKELSSAKVAITSKKKAATKAAQAKATAEKQLETLKTTLEEKQAEFKKLEEDAWEVTQTFEKVKEVEATKREELEAVVKECEELKRSQSDVKCVEIELLGQIEALDKQLVDSQKKEKHWSAELAKLRAAAAEDDDDYDSDEEEEDDDADSGDAATSKKASGSVADEEDGDDEEEDTDSDVEMDDASSTDGGDKKKKGSKAKKSAKKDKPSSSSSLPTLADTALAKYDKEDIKNDISILESERNTIAKNANMGAIAEYRKKEADYLARVSELDAVTEERNAVRRKHDELRRARLEMFMDGFGQISLKLKEMYQMITLGGDAELELVDSLDPFSEGIVFSVRPPKKSWKNISNLSGGEKTLSSLALVFALHHYKPTPLYVMDEIDAALDFKNVSIVANYIKERTKNAQFIIISLRNNMFELADRLVGIYKTNNCTKSVTVNPHAFDVQGSQQNGRVASTTPLLAEKTNKRSLSAMKKQQLSETKRRVSFHSAEEPSDSVEGE